MTNSLFRASLKRARDEEDEEEEEDEEYEEEEQEHERKRKLVLMLAAICLCAWFILMYIEEDSETTQTLIQQVILKAQGGQTKFMISRRGNTATYSKTLHIVEAKETLI